MELRQLEHFVAVAQEGSFTKAAARCYIVQSGLSASIRSLETELNARLFHRNSRKLTLTKEGEALLPEAHRALAAARAGSEAIAALQGLERGTLTIGAAKILPPPFDLVRMLHRFHVAHPGIQLQLRQHSSTELFRMMREGGLDIVIAGSIADQIEGVTQIEVARSPLVLACARTHRLATATSVTLADLAEESFVDMSPEWSTRLLAEAAFRQIDVVRRVNFEVNDPACLLALVELDLGIAIVPRMLDRLKAKVRYVPIEPELREWVLVAAFTGATPPTPASRAFLEMVMGEVG